MNLVSVLRTFEHDLAVRLLQQPDGLIRSITVDLPPLDWCSCCMREGEHYMGGCCGNMGMAQGYLNAAFADSGEFSSEDFAAYGELMRSHDGYCKVSLPDPRAQMEGDPIAKLMFLYDLYEPHLYLPPNKQPRVEPLTTVDDACRILGHQSWIYSMSSVFGGNDLKDQAHQLDTLLQVLPALAVLNRELPALLESMGTVTGWAVITAEGGLLKTPRGLGIFVEKVDADMLLRAWQEPGDEASAACSVQLVCLSTEGMTFAEAH